MGLLLRGFSTVCNDRACLYRHHDFNLHSRMAEKPIQKEKQR